MSGTRREFLRKVAQAGGYRATYLTMQAMGLLGTAALEKAADIAIGEAPFTRTVATGLLRDRAVRHKVPPQSVGIDFASSIGRDEPSKSR